MTGRATFADLPLELSESIILLTVHTWAVDDKSTVASLSRTSRAIHALVQPMLADTVVITAHDLCRIRAASASFRSTRRLVVDGILMDKIDDYIACAASFPALEMFSGTINALFVLLHVSKPVRVVLTHHLVPLDRVLARDRPSLSNVTYIRATTSSFVDFMTVVLDWSSLRISHLMLDVNVNVESPARLRAALLVTRIIPTILRLPKLERVCICITAGPAAVELRSELEAAAHDLEETRIYVEMDKACPSAWDPQAFDDEHWLAGKPLFTRG